MNNIGEEIRRLREVKNLKQIDLLDGLQLSQSELSKIEQGKVSPTVFVLQAIAEKFCITLDHFISPVTESQRNYVSGVYRKVRQEVRKRNYKEVLRIIKREKQSPLNNQLISFHQFMLWHEGICMFEVDGKSEEALTLLEQSLTVRGQNKLFWSENEISTLNSMGIIYYSIEDFKEAVICFEQALDFLRERPDKYALFKLHIRIINNLAKTHTLLHNFETSLLLCNKGLEYCQEHESLYVKGELLFQIGFNLAPERANDPEQCIYYLKKSRQVFELQENTAYFDLIDRHINKTEEYIRMQKDSHDE